MSPVVTEYKHIFSTRCREATTCSNPRWRTSWVSREPLPAEEATTACPNPKWRTSWLSKEALQVGGADTTICNFIVKFLLVEGCDSYSLYLYISFIYCMFYYLLMPLWIYNPKNIRGHYKKVTYRLTRFTPKNRFWRWFNQYVDEEITFSVPMSC
jgi:hypothetical protein